jgi:hypothetical protein
METKSSGARIATAAGTLLVWLPILFPLLLSLRFIVLMGRIRIDYLMPAELAPVFLVGALVLFFAAPRGSASRKSIVVSALLAVFFLVATQLTAVLTGLASGEREAVGWPLWLCNLFLASYTVSIIITGMHGIRLWRE